MKINPDVEDYHVAWITALPIELSAATAMLDAEYEGSDDTTLYTLGRVSRHNVVVVCLPAGQVGTSAAATTVTELRAKFPFLQIGPLVGVGGGVPSTEADIRLGDVVISQPQRNHGGVIQYDFSKIGPGGKHMPTGFVNGPPSVLLTALAKLKSNQLLGRSHILFQASYRHNGGATFDDCCKDKEIKRPLREGEDTVIHYGIVASGNHVMRDGETRNALSKEFGGILCFEMEAAGLLNVLPCVAIRGICDYANSHKNKSWQPYAAGIAAACAKELLAYVHAFSGWKSSGREMSVQDTATKRSSRATEDITVWTPD
ncbi:nucleoside phosphorylase domain-containing protein [Aspergillus aurantiobrunneus]